MSKEQSIELIIHKGAEEIGGNCVEIKTSKTTLLVDAGIPVSSENKAVDTSILKPNAILLSHAHYKHYGKLYELEKPSIETLFQQCKEAEQIALELFKKAMKNGGDNLSLIVLAFLFRVCFLYSIQDIVCFKLYKCHKFIV